MQMGTLYAITSVVQLDMATDSDSDVFHILVMTDQQAAALVNISTRMDFVG